jgi:NAD(P)-dependent dehydrogenase (short-subunit alcohol dehydrogenase family)
LLKPNAKKCFVLGLCPSNRLIELALTRQALREANLEGEIDIFAINSGMNISMGSTDTPPEIYLCCLMENSMWRRGMSNPTVIITGASRGLGAAVAQISAQMGCNVVLNARSVGDLKQVADRIQAEGGSVLIAPGDVSLVENCEDIVAKTVKQFGSVEVLINNAGIIEPIAPIAEGSPESWWHNLAVNVLAPVMLTQAALPHLRESSGRVINISSGAAVSVIPGWGAYCVSKAALNHFTRILAEEEPAITTIAFRPGVVDTAMQAVIREQGSEGMTEDSHARFVDLHEEGALLPPELPGRALAAVALHAPHPWSGQFIQWDEERVQKLIQ